MQNADDIRELDQLEKAKGVSCVRDIVRYLRQGRLDDARAVRVNEGDKTRVYPEIEAQLYKMFGCRLHGKHECGRCS